MRNIYHILGVYFWGADRFIFPQWLLAAMQFSGLWNDRFIDQVQVVAYLHSWERPETGGEFVYWDTDSLQPKSLNPVPRGGSAIDGSKTVHAAKVFSA